MPKVVHIGGVPVRVFVLDGRYVAIVGEYRKSHVVSADEDANTPEGVLEKVGRYLRLRHVDHVAQFCA